MFSLWRITFAGVLFLIIALFWTFVVGFSADQPGSFYNTGHNAIWIGHEWVGEAKTDKEVQELVQTLKSHQIDTVFVHVGPIEPSGNVSADRYRYAIQFVEQAEKFDKDIQYQAWLGQIRSKIDLSDEEVRHNVSNLSIILTEIVGFDGIHFDIEPVWDEDEDFILLLAEVREDLRDEKKISVALAELIPSAVLWFTEYIYEFKNYNTEVNYENVAEYADQVVAMVYDTGIKSEWFYRWVVKEETIRITDLVDGKEVFIAIPAYNDATEAYDPLIENVENGVRGIIDGLNNFRSSEENFAGVAIYPYWEIDDTEWEVYDQYWLKK